MPMNLGEDMLDTLDDAQAAEAFRRLVRHLRKRHDAQNIDLMGLAGFCRNCLADWIRDAGYAGDKAQARELIHGSGSGSFWLAGSAALPVGLRSSRASIFTSRASNSPPSRVEKLPVSVQ